MAGSEAAFAAPLAHEVPRVPFETIGSLVREPALVVELTTPLAEVCRLLIEHRVPAIAVLDGEHRLRGLVTRTDVLSSDGDARAADAMSGFVFAVPATASVARAAVLMSYEGVGQVVVTDRRGGLLGIVSAIDIVRHFARNSPSDRAALAP